MKETDIAGILTSTHTIALVGASDKPDRPSYRVMKYLLDPGVSRHSGFAKSCRQNAAGPEGGMARWQTFRKKSIWSMFSVIQKRRGAWHRKLLPLARKPSGCNWGVINEQAAVLARDAGLNVVMDRCPAIEIPSHWARPNKKSPEGKNLPGICSGISYADAGALELFADGLRQLIHGWLFRMFILQFAT